MAGDCQAALDAIDKLVVASLKVAESRDELEKIKWCGGTHRLRDYEHYADAATKCDEQITPRLWQEHLDALVEFGVSYRIANGAYPAAPAALAKYCAAPNSPLPCEPSWTTMMSLPIEDLVGPVNLASIPSILRRIARHRVATIPPPFLLYDVRHVFHHSPLPGKVQCFFAVKIKDGDTYGWRAPPLGHTVGPKVAETVARGLLSLVLGSFPERDQLPYCQQDERG